MYYDPPPKSPIEAAILMVRYATAVVYSYKLNERHMPSGEELESLRAFEAELRYDHGLARDIHKALRERFHK